MLLLEIVAGFQLFLENVLNKNVHRTLYVIVRLLGIAYYTYS